MTPSDLAAAKVAFVGTVVALRDSRGNTYADPAMFIPRLTGPQCVEGVVNGVATKWPADCMPELQYTSMWAVVFRVEEPIRGVGVGEFVARQSGGADCGTIFKLGARYIYGSREFISGSRTYILPSINPGDISSGGFESMTWIVPPGMTAREAIEFFR